MFSRIDRVQVVVSDNRAAAVVYERLLGAERVHQDRVNVLAARRVTLRLGVSEVEVIEPDGAGAAADFLSRTKGGLFAVGLATADISRLRSHLQGRGVSLTEEGDQIFLSPEVTGLPGLRAVISPEAERRPAGLIRCLYEATLLVHDFASVVEKTAAGFALEPSHFVPIRSEEFGYDGVLTLFHPDHLDRIEIVTPNDSTKTMGRFFARRGPGFYMCYAEADDLTLIRARLLQDAADDWTGPRDVAPTNIFIHPKVLGGLMLGVSRTSVAWLWSGHPDRVLESPAVGHA